MVISTWTYLKRYRRNRKAAADRYAGARLGDSKLARYEMYEHVRTLAELDPLELVKLGVEAVLSGELSNRYDGYAGGTPYLDWYLGGEQEDGNG